jgi:thiamine kinase-like enzyme
MEPSEVQRAVEAGSSIASALGLPVDGAVVVNNSNRVLVRLSPCDVLARVRPVVHQEADDLEVEVARRLVEAGSPVAELAPRVEPRVYVLHGEPHVGNLLRTREGLLFVDFETCCRGPVEFDIAHGLLPNEDGHKLPSADVCEHYPGANKNLIDQCRLLIWAMITTWRWQRGDQLPNGRYWRTEGLNQIRATLSGLGPDVLSDHS